MNMRKIIAVLAAMLMLCSIIPMGALVSAAGAVYSEDFEDGSLGTWSSNDAAASPVEVVAAADLPVANPNGGNYAVKQTLGGYHYMSDKTAFTVEPNTDYVLTVDALMGNNNWPVEVLVANTSWLSGAVLATGQVKISNASWTTLTYIFNSGNNTKLYAGFKSNWENVTVYFDNYSIAPCSPETMGNTDGHLYNGDFETGAVTPWGTSANATVVDDPTGAGMGKVMKTNENTGSVTMFNQTARNLKANTYYKLSFKVYGYTTAVSNAAFWVQFPKTVTDWSVDVGNSGFSSQAANDYTPRINVNSKLNAWYDVSITFNTGDLTAVNINFMNYRVNGGQYYFDNIKVREVTAPSFDGYITNGDFETGDLTGWTVTAGKVADENGNTILQGTATKKYGNFVHQIVDVEANTEYAISFRVKGAVSGGIARLYAGTGTGNTGSVNSTYSWNVSDTAWTNVTVSFNSGSNTQLYINLCQGKDNGGDIYFDDILMFEVKDPSFDGYITNGDFETGTAAGVKLASQSYVSAAAAKDGLFGLYMINSAGNWGGVASWTVTTLEPGATYKLEMDMKTVSKGFNWTLWQDDSKSGVKYASGYFSTTAWTHIEKEFVANTATAYLNINGGNTGVSEEVYLDNLKITKIKDAHTCNVVEQERVDATCTADGYVKYACDCGLGEYTETITAKGHTWDDATCTAPKTCSVCGATEGEALGHTYTPVETLAPTCGADGVMTYTCACGDSYTDAIPATGEHTYDDQYDADCNVCGGIREVPSRPVVEIGGSAVSEDVNGLAFRFDVNATGGAVYENTRYVYLKNSATITVDGTEYALKYIGAIVSNKAGVEADDLTFEAAKADGKRIINVKGDNVFDVTADRLSYAIRIIDIPDTAKGAVISARSYFMYENAEGKEVKVYGDLVSASYNEVLAR